MHHRLGYASESLYKESKMERERERERSEFDDTITLLAMELANLHTRQSSITKFNGSFFVKL